VRELVGLGQLNSFVQALASSVTSEMRCWHASRGWHDKAT